MPISYETLQYRKTNNLCEKCGNLNAEGKRLCQKHLDQAAARTTKRRNKSKALGLCTRCHKTAPLPNLSLCEQCKAYEKKQSKPRSKKRYDRLKNSSCCVNCSVKLDIDDGIRCKSCASIDRQQMQVMRDDRRANNLCTICGKNPIQTGKKTYCEDCSKSRSEWYATSATRDKNIERMKQDRLTVFNHYRMSCACCEEKTLEFLEIDHIDICGNQHRKQINKYGSTFYRWLIDNKFPEGYQTLCRNCNTGRYRNGGICPHQQEGNKS